MASNIKIFTMLYSTLLPKHKRRWPKLRLASPHHGTFTPAGISAGCPPLLRRLTILLPLQRSTLGRDRSIIIDWRGYCETDCHGLFFGRMGTAWHLNWPSLTGSMGENEQKKVASYFISQHLQVVLAHPPRSLCRFRLRQL